MELEVENEKQEEMTKIRTPLAEFIRKFLKQKTAMVALIFIGFIVFLAIFGSELVPYGIEEFDYNFITKVPSIEHFFGTDEFGRDIFSRVVCGTRLSLLVGLLSVTTGAICGTFLGLISGYYGGVLDSVIMLLCDTLFAFPGIVLAIGIVAILGPGVENIIIAVAVFSTPTFARLVRSSTLGVKKSVFVQAAKNIGTSNLDILIHHILPSALPNIIVQYTMTIGTSILTASSLSFLGMGAQPPTAEWGLMLNNGRSYMMTYPYIAFFPGCAIFFTVLSFNLLGDGLRDALDPKLSD